MANAILQYQDTDTTWEPAGGDEVLTLTNMADGAGRAGDEHDFGAKFPIAVRVELETKFAVSPTAGEIVEIMWSSSIDGTNYDGECTGSDAAYSDENDQKRLYLVGVLACTNDTSVQRQSWIFILPARYGLPVVGNQSGQAMTNTAGDHKLTVTPLISEIQ